MATEKNNISLEKSLSVTSFIDLTQPLNENTPVYPGDPRTIIKPSAVFTKDGYTDHFISIGTHVGTHIDAPLHMLENGKALNEFKINYFIGQGIVVDASNSVGEIGVETIKDLYIERGDCVLFYTGWAKRYHDAEYFTDYPVMSDALATYIVNKKVKLVGVDMCSPDKEPFRVHKKLLSNDILIIENLTNLDKLLNKTFRLYALPLNVEIDAAPARVVAEVK